MNRPTPRAPGITQLMRSTLAHEAEHGRIRLDGKKELDTKDPRIRVKARITHTDDAQMEKKLKRHIWGVSV